MRFRRIRWQRLVALQELSFVVGGRIEAMDSIQYQEIVASFFLPKVNVACVDGMGMQLA